MRIPDKKTALSKPTFIVKIPPNKVKLIVVIQPTPFENKPISNFEKPISL